MQNKMMRPAIWSALAVVALFGMAQTALAQGVNVYSTGPNGSVMVTKYKPPVTPSCLNQNPDSSGADFFDWLHCVFIYIQTAGLTEKSPLFRTAGSATPRASQASGNVNLTLRSSVPYLPFLGNRLVVISYVANAQVLANATAAYEVVLRRQPDCSLVEDLTLPGSATPAATYFASLPGAQDYFHQLAGLTTTPDVFANGCGYRVLGVPATAGVLLLGSTSDGGAIGVTLTENGALQASVTDLTANTFKTTTLSSSESAGGFSAASLRNNGIMDIVQFGFTDPATQQFATAVHLGNGDGTFQPPVYYDVLGSLIDDVNGDGIPDIVALTTTSITREALTGTVTTLFGNGDGTFTTGPVSPYTVASGGSLVGGDFNGDGNEDLLLGGTVLFGGGDGTFKVGPTNISIASAFTSSGAPGAVGDLRNSGNLDLVVSKAGGVAIFYGNGDGTFQTGPSYAGLPDFLPVTITDIDGDGNPDIVLGVSTAGVYTDGGYDIEPPLIQILMGRGDGTFVDSLQYQQGTYGAVGPQIASADFNGDGLPDVLVINPNNSGTSAPSTLAVLPGDGAGNLGAPISSAVSFKPEMVVSADMNGDGKPDAVVAGGFEKLAVLFNQGNGTFAGEQDYSLPDSPISLATGDFNGDGLMDVAVGISPGQGGTGPSGVYVLLGQANGKLAAPVQIDMSFNPTGLTAGDLNGDGRTDLVVADQGSFYGAGNGVLHVYLGNPDGSFTAAPLPSTSATVYTVAALGDLNADGMLDLILAGEVIDPNSGNATPDVYTLVGNGDGTFQAANTLALAGPDGIGATTIAVADFNQDGALDVVVGNQLDYTEMLFGNGDGTLTGTLLALGQRPVVVAAADLNGDGFPELLVGQYSTLTVFLNANSWTAPPLPMAR